MLLGLSFFTEKLTRKKVKPNSLKFIIKISKFNMKPFCSMAAKYKDIGKLRTLKDILYSEEKKILNFRKKPYKC